MIRFWREASQGEPELHLTNVFDVRPPENDVEFFFAGRADKVDLQIGLLPYRTGKYLQSEHYHHLEKLWAKIDLIRPNLVLALGNTACWALLNRTNISKIRGTVELSPRLKIKVLPTYHPAAVLRDWSLRTILLADLTKAKREAQFSEVRRIERWITCHDHRLGDQGRIGLDEIKSWLAKPASCYAIDIESGYALFSKQELDKLPQSLKYIISSQISMVGFARSANESLVIPIMDRNCPNLSYWSNSFEERLAWKLIRQGLMRNIPKIFQNGLYDMGRFLAMGLSVKSARDDTMLRHHALYPELLKSLGFLGSIYSNEVSWKTMYDNKETLKKDE